MTASVMEGFLPVESVHSQVELSAAMNRALMEFLLAIVAVEGQAIILLLREADYRSAFEHKAELLATINLC